MIGIGAEAIWTQNFAAGAGNPRGAGLIGIGTEAIWTQKFAAGINKLLVGPSDSTAACAMIAALSGEELSTSFQTCYEDLDNPADEWGFGGQGADFFGQ